MFDPSTKKGTKYLYHHCVGLCDALSQLSVYRSSAWRASDRLGLCSFHPPFIRHRCQFLEPTEFDIDVVFSEIDTTKRLDEVNSTVVVGRSLKVGAIEVGWFFVQVPSKSPILRYSFSIYIFISHGRRCTESFPFCFS